MKTHNIVLSLVIGAVMFFSVSASGSAPPQKQQTLPVPPVELGTDVNNLVFTGTVKRIPDGTALVTNTATYLLTGGNFDGIVGREVNIIGKVIKDGSREKIKVARAQLAHE